MKSGIASDAGAFGSEAKTSPQDTLVVDLADLVVPKQVQVVQELDLGKLSITLQSIVDAVNSIPAARPEDAPTRGDLDALHKEVEKLKEELKVKDTKIADLASKQEKLTEQLANTVSKQDIDPKGFKAMTEKQAAQEERLAKLEASASQDVGEPLAPKVDQMAKDLHDLHKAVDAVKAAASKAAGEAAAALGAAGAPKAPGAAGHAGGESAQGNQGQLSDALASEIDALTRQQKEMEARVSAKQKEVDDSLKNLADMQDTLRKSQKESSNVAADAQAAAHGAEKKLGDQAAQLSAIRSAVEALNNGEKVELPPPAPAAAQIDLGPLERRVAQKADADDLAAAEKRLEKLEAAIREAREAAEVASAQQAVAGKQVADLRKAMNTLQTALASGGSAPANAGGAEHHYHTTTTNNNTSSVAELSEIRSELKELKAALAAVLERARTAVGADDLGGVKADIEALRRALAGKASQADLDAMLAAGIPAPASGGESERPAAAADGQMDPTSATTEGIAVNVNDMKAKLLQLQNLIKLLQGRMADKASVDETEAMKRSHNMLTEKIIRIENRLEEIKNASHTTKELNRQVSHIEQRLKIVEAGAASALHDGSGGVPGGTGKDAVSAQGLMLIEEGLRRAMSEIEDLRSMLSDVSKLKRSVAHAEALRDEVDSSMAALRDGLRSVQEAMSRKADRSEMDAMLDAGVAFGPGNMAGAAGAVQRQLDEAADSKDIVGMLNDLANKVTAISTAQKVFQERLGGKADLAALETKAGKDDVARLQAAMQSKAPLDALAELRDELARLKSQLEAQRGVARVANVPSGPSSLPRGIDPTAGIDSDLRSQLRNKADRSEIQGLQDALAGLQAQLLGNSAIPQGKHPIPSAGHTAAGDSGLAARLAALEKQVADLSGALEMVAHAANILAVGEAHAMTPTSDASHHQGPGTAGDVSGSGLGAGGGEPGDEANRSGNTAADNTSSASSAAPGIFGGSTGMAGASGALAGTGLASAKNGVSLTRQGIPTGAVDKLRNMCANKHFNRKMDWFDPAWLQDLARRVGDLEGAVRALKKAKAPPQAEIPVRSAGGGKDYDKAIMKLGRDINNLRKQLADALQGLGNRGGSSGGFSRVPDGDHAMLSSKPLLGYRCMACDRPLEKLDENPGPYIPTNLMPVNVTPYERRGLGLPVPHDAPPKPMHEAKPSSEQVAMRGVRAGSDGRGPQNWYKDIHGKPGDSLPAREVGPILPPGGWRGNETGVPVVPTNAAGRQVDKLPGLVPEGTGNAVGGLAPARGGPTTLPNIS